MEQKELQKQARSIWWISLLFALYLASTTGYLLFTMTANFSPAARIAISIAGIILIDVFNGYLLRVSLYAMLSKEAKGAMGIGLFATLFLIAHARFAATTSATYLSRTPMAAAIVGEVQGDTEIAAIEQAKKERAALVAKMEKEKNRVAGSEARRLRDARKEGQKLINAAIESQGANVAQLYRAGNGWVMSDRKFKAYRDGIRKAKEQAAELEKAARNETKAASEAFLASTAQDTAYTSTLTKMLANKVERNEKLTGVYNFTLGVLDIVFGVLYWFLCLFLAQFKKEHNIEYESPFAGVFGKVGDKISEDVLQGTERGALGFWWLVSFPFAAFFKFARFIGGFARYRIIGWIESLTNIDLDGNGDIGNKNPAPAAQPAQNPPTNSPTNSPRKIIPGFVWNNYGKRNKNPPTSTPTNRADIPNVGLTPTMPALSPTNPLQNLGANPPTNPPTLAEKVGKKLVKSRAQKGREVTNLAEAVRTAYKKGYNTFESLKAQAIKEGFTVVVENGKITVAKPLNIAAQAKEAFKTYLADNNNREKWDTWKEWERKLKAAGFTVVTSPGGRKVSIVKPRPQDRKRK